MQKPIIRIAIVFLSLVLLYGTITPVLAINSTCTDVGIFDQTAPTVIADIVLFENDKQDDKGKFIVEFSGSDTCNTSPRVTATLYDITVTNGQPVILEIDDKNKVKTKLFNDVQCAKFQEDANDLIDQGESVPKNLQWDMLICETGGELLEIQASTIQLSVIVTDSAGNMAFTIITPVFVNPD